MQPAYDICEAKPSGQNRQKKQSEEMCFC